MPPSGNRSPWKVSRATVSCMLMRTRASGNQWIRYAISATSKSYGIPGRRRGKTGESFFRLLARQKSPLDGAHGLQRGLAQPLASSLGRARPWIVPDSRNQSQSGGPLGAHGGYGRFDDRGYQGWRHLET